MSSVSLDHYGACMITLFRIATFLSALISTILSVYVYTKRDKSPSLKFLSGLMIANMVYATSYLFEISAPVRAELIFFLNLEYTGIVFIPVFWVLIAWTYQPDHTKNNHDLVRKLRRLYIIPIITIIFIWTNRWHHLMYRSIDIEFVLPITLLKVDRGIGFWIVNGMMLLLFLIGTGRMIYNLITAKSGQRRHYLLLTLASLPPFTSYLVVLTQSVPHKLDLNPIAFAISGLLIYWGITNMQLFHMVPIAEHMVVDAMHDAMIVLDTKGELIESNKQAHSLFAEENTTFIGMPIDELNPELSSILSKMDPAADVEITLPKTGERRTFTVSHSPIADKRNRVRAHLFLLHDVTIVRKYVLELEHTASSDGLTGLLNHRHFMERANEEVRRVEEIGSGQFSLIMFDLDHFKAINDTHGHSAGDMVLQQIGRMTREFANPDDLCARYGGEEFIMLLMDTPLDEAYAAASSLCSIIRDTPFEFEGRELMITASFGVSSFSPESGEPWEVALNRADTALYEAKAAGRNCVKTQPG